MSNYDLFGPFYDAVMGDRRDVISVVQKAIKAHHLHANSLLDLGCGTGSILDGFKDAYELHGIDQSAKMLQIAQRKLPKASLTQGSIAGFDLHRQFDIIICLFDTINHLTSFADWQKLLRSSKKHLRSNGLFIFDMNTIGRLRALTAMPDYIQDFKTGTMQMHITATGQSEVEWHVTIQEPLPDGAIQVYEERVREAAFPLGQVTSELQKHFSILEAFDSYGDPPTDSSDRIYFVCR